MKYQEGQDGVVGHILVTGTWSGDSLCSMEQGVAYGLVCWFLSTFCGGKALWSVVKMIN